MAYANGRIEGRDGKLLVQTKDGATEVLIRIQEEDVASHEEVYAYVSFSCDQVTDLICLLSTCNGIARSNKK